VVPAFGRGDASVFLRSEQFAKLIRGKSCVASDSAHCECVDWIVAGYRDDSGAISHHNVFPLDEQYEIPLS